MAVEHARGGDANPSEKCLSHYNRVHAAHPCSHGTPGILGVYFCKRRRPVGVSGGNPVVWRLKRSLHRFYTGGVNT